MPQLLSTRLGTTAHLSPLIHKANRLGLRAPEDLEHLALARGLRYFGRVPQANNESCTESVAPAPNPEQFSNEELAIALMSPTLPYSLNRLRMAAAMLGAHGISAGKILRLARLERCETIVRYIAECASHVEPAHPLWQTLLHGIPASPSLAPDILPHPSRFVAMSGLDRTGRNPRTQWIRPSR
jgi:hypothetical protein